MYQQIQLPYAYDALEPYIDALTMETHYIKHHAAYTKNLNEAAEKAGDAVKAARYRTERAQRYPEARKQP